MKKVLFCSIILLSLAFFGCKKEKTPTACFTVEYYGNPPTHVDKLTNCSTDADHYEWDLGNGQKSASTDISYPSYTTGTYTVKLTAYSATEKKTDVATKTITIY